MKKPTVKNIHSWTAELSRRWLARCDSCGKRRLVADYFEGYLSDKWNSQTYNIKVGTWIWVCSSCLVDEISDRIIGGLRQ